MKRMGEKRPMKPAEALVRLETLCSRSEQCTSEVVTRLVKWGIGSADQRNILASLKRDRYVDDARYAVEFVRDKVLFNRWGRVKIKAALRLKRLDNEIIDEAIDSIDEQDYRQALVEVLQAKARSMDEIESYESRMKLARHAISRGFETAMVLDLIKYRGEWC